MTFGNPHEMPLAGLVDAVKRRAEPRSVDWFMPGTIFGQPAHVRLCLTATRAMIERALPRGQAGGGGSGGAVLTGAAGAP